MPDSFAQNILEVAIEAARGSQTMFQAINRDQGQLPCIGVTLRRCGGGKLCLRSCGV